MAAKGVAVWKWLKNLFGFGLVEPVITYEEQRAKARASLETRREAALLYGAKLRAARRKNKLRQSDVGELIGCSGVNISDIELGQKSPSARERFELARLFGSELT